MKQKTSKIKRILKTIGKTFFKIICLEIIVAGLSAFFNIDRFKINPVIVLTIYILVQCFLLWLFVYLSRKKNKWINLGMGLLFVGFVLFLIGEIYQYVNMKSKLNDVRIKDNDGFCFDCGDCGPGELCGHG